MQPFVKQDQHFLVDGPSGALEVMTTWPDQGAPSKAAIICHPHPLYEGSMHNKVVTTCARAYQRLGLATVRFNFRGVGQSTGEYGNVAGEIDDCLAIVNWVQHVLPDCRLALAGFSFGSYVAAVAATQTQPSHLLSIAPPVARMAFAKLQAVSCPWLVIQGEADEVADCAATQQWVSQHKPQPQLMTLPGVGHFFHGYLVELRDIIMRWAQELPTC